MSLIRIILPIFALFAITPAVHNSVARSYRFVIIYSAPFRVVATEKFGVSKPVNNGDITMKLHDSTISTAATSFTSALVDVISKLYIGGGRKVNDYTGANEKK